MIEKPILVTTKSFGIYLEHTISKAAINNLIITKFKFRDKYNNRISNLVDK